MTKQQNILRILRAEKNWNQETVAGKLGISIPAYSKIETGITDVNLSRLKQIALLYNLPVYELLRKIEHGPDVKVDTSEVLLKDEILKRKDQEIIQLQSKVIQLFEENKLLHGNIAG